eukprot:2526579-Karenia_brevis.AAC.1
MRSDSMPQAIMKEFDEQPAGPRIILGDVNADPDDLEILHSNLNEGASIDVGAHAQIFDQPALQPTCYPPNNVAPTRRDFVFVSADFFPFVTLFQ